MTHYRLSFTTKAMLSDKFNVISGTHNIVLSSLKPYGQPCLDKYGPNYNQSTSYEFTS
jgi:hypothetical protein